MSTQELRARSCIEVAALLGLHERPIRSRTLESARAEVLASYEKHGRRPSEQRLSATGQWLRYRGSSLRRVCDELGLPGGTNLGRTKEGAKTVTQGFFDKHGRRPVAQDLRAWDSWLRGRGSSLVVLCDEMGLPERTRIIRRKSSATRMIRAFYQEQGRCPEPGEIPVLDRWLHKHALVLSLLCDELSLPSDWGDAKKTIQEFFNKHGRRPKSTELPQWARWLRAQGSSLSRLCDELEFPGPGVPRTKQMAQHVIRAFVQKNGHRPSEASLPDWYEWLRHVPGVSLQQLCNEMGVP